MPDQVIDTELSLERRLRRQATAQGLALVKSRCRDERALEFGGFMVIDPATKWIVAGGHPWAFSLGLDDVERVLAEG